MTIDAVPSEAASVARAYVTPVGFCASYQDLVQARHNATWGADLAKAHSEYVETLVQFTAKEGDIVQDYWAERFPAAVAVTRTARRRRSRLELHRETTQLVARRPEFSGLLLHLDREAIRASNVLSGMTQAIAMSNLFALGRDVTGSLAAELTDATAGSNGRRNLTDGDEPLLDIYRRQLDEIRDYVSRAGARTGLIIYLKGTAMGLITLLVLVPLLAMLFSSLDVPGVDPTLFVACVLAGSFGAVVSVLMRMSSDKFAIDHEIGRGYVTSLGFARPFIGAVFALLLYFAFKGGLLAQIALPTEPPEELAFFVATGFVTGFSERLAKDIVATTEGVLGQASDTMPQQRPARKRSSTNS